MMKVWCVMYVLFSYLYFMCSLHFTAVFLYLSCLLFCSSCFSCLCCFVFLSFMSLLFCFLIFHVFYFVPSSSCFVVLWDFIPKSHKWARVRRSFFFLIDRYYKQQRNRYYKQRERPIFSVTISEQETLHHFKGSATTQPIFYPLNRPVWLLKAGEVYLYHDNNKSPYIVK